ncbi:MAG: right-handed parallel beta-helix repeat-containing protein [Candidatus Schekmanbacteria bacterium]|nr:right-handed parallel beta-helix repeat-containing protein [Candidatus Schekmanbacteria bacterium]
MRALTGTPLVLFALLSACIGCGDAADEQSLVTDGRYVSSTDGDDSNDGRSAERPWKTLARACRETFGPGATIYLKRGDTWNEPLIPKGSGDFEQERWITIQPYGPADGPKPTIDRTAAAGADSDFAVKLVDVEAWRLVDLAVRNSRTGIVYVASDEKTRKRGLQIVRCDLRNIRGLADHQPTPEEDRRTYWWMRGSAAISITGYGYCKDGLPATDASCQGDKNLYLLSYGAGLSDVTIEDVTVDLATYGIWIWGGGFSGQAARYRIQRPRIVNAGIGGIELTYIQNGTVTGAVVDRAGGDNCWSGTFGIDINYATDLAIQSGEVTGTLGEVFYMGDGTGINLAGGNRNVTISGVDIHDNDAMAIAIEGASATENATYEIAGNRIWGNGRKNENPAPGQYEYPEFLLALNIGGLTSAAAVRDNWIKMRANRHLLCAVIDSTTPCFKDDLAMEGETRFPPGYSFCGNRDWSRGETDPPLIPGNSVCPARS